MLAIIPFYPLLIYVLVSLECQFPEGLSPTFPSSVFLLSNAYLAQLFREHCLEE